MAVQHEYRRASLAPPRQEEVPDADVFIRCCVNVVTRDGGILTGSISRIIPWTQPHFKPKTSFKNYGNKNMKGNDKATAL